MGTSQSDFKVPAEWRRKSADHAARGPGRCTGADREQATRLGCSRPWARHGTRNACGLGLPARLAHLVASCRSRSDDARAGPASGPHNRVHRRRPARHVLPRRDSKLARQHPPKLRLRDDHRHGPGAHRRHGIPAGRPQARARDGLYRREAAPGGDRHLRHAVLAGLRHHQQAARGLGRHTGHG